jgi:hypothetical protein
MYMIRVDSTASKTLTAFQFVFGALFMRQTTALFIWRSAASALSVTRKKRYQTPFGA